MDIPIPKEIKSASHTYQVSIEFNVIRDTEHRGQVNSHTQVMRIDACLAPTEMAAVFLHECAHTVNWHYCNEAIGEETLACFMEGFAQVLQSMGINFVREEL